MKDDDYDILNRYKVNKYSDNYKIGYLDGYSHGMRKGEKVGYERGIAVSRRKIIAELKETFPELRIK